MNDAEIAAKQEHYKKRARYYSNYAILKRVKSAVHLEAQDDKRFWEPLFAYYFPNDKFRFITYSKSYSGNNATGCTQCLAYRQFLNKNFVVCIDSDYRYLLEEANVDIEHSIFQTYTYSFENHICFSKGLSDICKAICGFENKIYDFDLFFSSYSAIVYNLFVWHIGLVKIDKGLFSTSEFVRTITIEGADFDISNQSLLYIEAVHERVKQKLQELEKYYPSFDWEKEKQALESLGVNPQNVYLYIRGHNLYSLCMKLVKGVCELILDKESEKLSDSAQKKELYSRRKKFKDIIYQNIQFDLYPEILKIKEDMTNYASLF